VRALTKPYPFSTGARKEVREGIIAAAVERIRYSIGYSANCADAVRYSHEHRCANDGSTCICVCHDRAEEG